MVVVLALIVIGVRWRKNGLQGIFPSEVEKQATQTVFVQVAKKYALTIPAKWNVTEPVSGKQTIIYPTGTDINSQDAQALIDKDVIIIETAVNKKDTFAALVDSIKANAEKAGSTVNAKEKDYGSIKASVLTVKGKANYQQIFFDTPTVIIATAKIDNPILDEVAKSVTNDLSPYSANVTQATNLARETSQNIAASKFSDIYQGASDNLKKTKSTDEFGALLKDVSSEFNDSVLIWGVFINDKGLGAAVNISNQDKISRRASFYYLKQGDGYQLDALRISGKISSS